MAVGLASALSSCTIDVQFPDGGVGLAGVCVAVSLS